MCNVIMDGQIELDEWIVINLDAFHYVVCDIVDGECWSVPKMLFDNFMRQFYRRAKKFEVACP